MNIKFLSFCLFFLLSTLCAAAGNLPFQDAQPNISRAHITAGSAASRLRTAYAVMYMSRTLPEFADTESGFDEEIFDQVAILPTPPDQTEYTTEIQLLLQNMDNIPSSLVAYFRKHKKKLKHRLSLAKLDQQLHDGLGARSDLAPIFSNLIGKIFRIATDGAQVKVSHRGSGMLVSISRYKPDNLLSNRIYNLNAIMTCAHVIESDEEERILGIYFVPNDQLDPISGFPRDLPDGANSAALIRYLTESPSSYVTGSYSTQQRSMVGVRDFISNSTIATQPQYLENEDIAFLPISLKRNQPYRTFHDRQYSIEFDLISLNEARNTRARYFAIGYPGCDHYDLDTLSTGRRHRQLIDHDGYSPLFVTSATGTLTHNNGGSVQHAAPTAKGMSGGPIIIISGNQFSVAGVISSGDVTNEFACY